jgi:hypothetical protein
MNHAVMSFIWFTWCMCHVMHCHAVNSYESWPIGSVVGRWGTWTPPHIIIIISTFIPTAAAGHFVTRRPGLQLPL